METTNLVPRWFHVSIQYQIDIVGTIVDLVCKEYDVTPSEILSPRRMRRIAFPRQVCYWLIREITPLSFPVIGRLMKKDYTTIIHGANKIDLIIEKKKINQITELKNILVKKCYLDNLGESEYDFKQLRNDIEMDFKRNNRFRQAKLYNNKKQQIQESGIDGINYYHKTGK